VSQTAEETAYRQTLRRTLPQTAGELGGAIRLSVKFMVKLGGGACVLRRPSSCGQVKWDGVESVPTSFGDKLSPNFVQSVRN
jgi:hypothetical protein